MADIVCLEGVDALNLLFGTALILNDGHEILARLEAGDDVADIAEPYAEKLGKGDMAEGFVRLMKNWPPLQMEAITEMVQWALSKLDTDDRVMIRWKGDDESPETVTRFELGDHTLLIEFAHPPGSLQAAGAGT